MKRMKFLLCVISLLALNACENDPPLTENTGYTNGLFVLCEGTFTQGNASVDHYNPDSAILSTNVFTMANERSLGDIAQSMFIDQEDAYIVVNNSSKIEKVRTKDMTSVGTIEGLTSPRYFVKIRSDKAYVSDLFSNTIHVIDQLSLRIDKEINSGGWTEQMLFHEEEVLVANLTHDQIMVFDPDDDSLIDSIKVGREPASMALDGEGKLWVLCTGGFMEAPPVLHRIDPASRTVEASWEFSSIDESPSRLTYDWTNNRLLFLNNGLFEMPVTASDLPAQPLIETGSSLFYGLSVDPSNGDIYVSDAVDFLQSGVVYRYSAQGDLLDSFTTGIAPSGFAFVE